MHAVPQGGVDGVAVAQAPVYGVAPQALQAPGPEGGYALLAAPYPHLHPPRWPP